MDKFRNRQNSCPSANTRLSAYRDKPRRKANKWYSWEPDESLPTITTRSLARKAQAKPDDVVTKKIHREEDDQLEAQGEWNEHQSTTEEHQSESDQSEHHSNEDSCSEGEDSKVEDNS